MIPSAPLPICYIFIIIHSGRFVNSFLQDYFRDLQNRIHKQNRQNVLQHIAIPFIIINAAVCYMLHIGLDLTALLSWISTKMQEMKINPAFLLTFILTNDKIYTLNEI